MTPRNAVFAAPEAAGDDGVATPGDPCQATRAGTTESGEELFSCQATELHRAASTSQIPFWDPRQYVRDVRSGNATVSSVVRRTSCRRVQQVSAGEYRLLPRLPLIRGGKKYPFVEGR